METRLRSWSKSVTWRLIGIAVLGGISYAMTRDWEQTTVITAVFHSLRFVLYYYHERLWARIPWGRVDHPLSCLPVRDGLTPEDYAAVRHLLKDRNCLLGPEYEI